MYDTRPITIRLCTCHDVSYPSSPLPKFTQRIKYKPQFMVPHYVTWRTYSYISIIVSRIEIFDQDIEHSFLIRVA